MVDDSTFEEDTCNDEKATESLLLSHMGSSITPGNAISIGSKIISTRPKEKVDIYIKRDRDSYNL